MKKVLSIILLLIMLFSLIACGNKTPEISESNTETSQNTTLNETTEGEIAEFVPPENYATVLLVTINPQIRLYLDADGNVLAVEAVNKDAKKIMEQLSVEEVHYTEAMEQIVSKANESDFIKSTTVVHIEISETKDNPVDKNEVLNEISEVVNQVAPELKLQVKVKVKEHQPSEETTATISPSTEETTAPATKPTTPPTEDPAPTQCSHTYKDATCTTPKTCNECGATEGKANGHSWKNATCTVPKTCSTCGTTEGSAAGHNWKDATCTTAKICSVCNITEGNPTEHKYDNGKCSSCGKEDMVNPQEHFEPTSYVSIKVDGDKLTFIEIEWDGTRYGYLESWYFKFDAENPPQGVILKIFEYEGEKYYAIGGGGPSISFKLTDKYIEFYDPGDTLCAKFILQHDGSLRLHTDYPDTTKLSFPHLFTKGSRNDFLLKTP
ncbi:MAG: hypothetical protein IKB80_00310 [Oscillospiraceae bacterium]|nr:hypothetical protein [Oscillospiraceae bacterium]